MNNYSTRANHRFQHLLPNIVILTIAAILFISYQSWASSAANPASTEISPNPVIAYQGSLTNELGQPINQALPMSFRLYDSLAATTALWTEVYSGTNAVLVQNGQFQVWLGSQNPFPNDLWNTSARYLGIQIDNDAEMSPRELLGSTPNALYAAAASTVAKRSIDSSKLALQQQIRSLDSATPISATSSMTAGIGAEITASELTIELNKTSRILYIAQAIATYSDASTVNTIQVVVDGAIAHRYQTQGQTLATIAIVRYIDLAAGSHRITLNYLASTPDSQISLQNDPAASFVSYLVVDQQ